jgi:2,5-diamino-6-(ribosylamino)-4(3H)-pyrimidinone 5'-phosphate reductase
MRPHVVMSNLVSLNGSLTGFPGNIESYYPVYYPVLLSYSPEMMLTGSNTVKMAATPGIPEVESDKHRRLASRSDTRPYYAIADSRGILEGLLHEFRRMEYIRDIIVLVSKSTPGHYLDYLKEREYDFIISGSDHIDFAEAFEELGSRYSVTTIVTDTGGTLNSVLLDAGLIDEISLVVAPVLCGKVEVPVYNNPGGSIQLELVRSHTLDGGFLHLVYRVFSPSVMK